MSEQPQEPEFYAKDGVIYLKLDDGGTVGWPMRYMAHAVEVVDAYNAALAAEREKLRILVDALERLQTTRASEHQAIIADALAKVKEGK